MSIFKDEYERNKFLLEQSSIILAGLLNAPDERYNNIINQLIPGTGPFKTVSLIDLQAAIFRDLKDRFKAA
jgi:hypothetical protein